MAVCPDCGARLSRPDRAGGYALVDCVAETRTASIYRARRIGDTADVCLRLYDADVAIAPEQERALRERFAALRALPADRFVHTLDFGWDAALACWYRVTPWLPNVKAWGDFKCRALAGADDAKRDWIAVCLDLADSFRELHRLGRAIPDFTLDDCLLYRADDGALDRVAEVSEDFDEETACASDCSPAGETAPA